MKMEAHAVIIIFICGFISLCECATSRRFEQSRAARVAPRNNQFAQQLQQLRARACTASNTQNNITANTLKFMHKTMPELSGPLNYTHLEWESLIKNVTNFHLDFEPIGKSEVSITPMTTTPIRSQIIGGSFATAGQFKFLVSMTIEGAYLCGASCISSRWVVTACHCTYTFSNFMLMFGVLNKDVDEEGRVIRNPIVKYEHPNFNPNTLVNDIALIKLISPVTITSTFIDIVRLPKKSDAKANFDGMEATVCGFGLTEELSKGGTASNQLKYLKMNIISNVDCAKTFGSYVTSNNICCQNKVDGKVQSTCSGDSGGPLVKAESDGIPTLYGIVSYGSSKGCTEGPSVFTRVCGFLGWISSITDILIRN